MMLPAAADLRCLPVDSFVPVGLASDAVLTSLRFQGALTLLMRLIALEAERNVKEPQEANAHESGF